MSIGLTRLGLSLFLPALTTGCVGPADEPPNTLVVSFETSRYYPASLLRFAGGPNREVVLDGAGFRQDGGRLVSDSTTIPPRGQWPTTVALVSPTGDTLAAASPSLNLEPGKIVTVSLLALPNLAGWFICARIVARVPIQGSLAPPDTLYVLSAALRADEQPPVC